ncbi:hypothetical protein RZS28_01550 [Methylocapsa polymorpha]|uniref:Uncharacterized protein n=1 Tax=Methylocapsa polymorpha TaxID=3080828 RepID=A0ABZ0HRU6_9HYPH|nr:hypothetical protein RZS28_01550 [Methylocapsa sp. RX1]
MRNWTNLRIGSRRSESDSLNLIFYGALFFKGAPIFLNFIFAVISHVWVWGHARPALGDDMAHELRLAHTAMEDDAIFAAATGAARSDSSRQDRDRPRRLGDRGHADSKRPAELAAQVRDEKAELTERARISPHPRKKHKSKGAMSHPVGRDPCPANPWETGFHMTERSPSLSA